MDEDRVLYSDLNGLASKRGKGFSTYKSRSVDHESKKKSRVDPTTTCISGSFVRLTVSTVKVW